jgi:CRP-like cAMP-binding protein
VESLFNYINKIVPNLISESDFNEIKKSFVLIKIKKKQYFLQEGAVCTDIGFVVKGALKQFYVDSKGVEHVISLFIENYWVSDRESSITKTPSKYNIQAVENSEILIIPRLKILEITERTPALIEMFRVLDERNLIVNQRRLSFSISNSAEEKYIEFSKIYPQFVSRFRQHTIASFLGITKETLSRVKKKIQVKK